MFEKIAESKNESSNRRGFLHRILGLGAAAGAASLLLNRDKSLIPLAQAGSGTGATVDIDEINYGVGKTELDSNNAGAAAFLVKNESGVDESKAIRGWVSSTNGITYGVLGTSNSVSGMGVFGEATATTGNAFGVQGYSYSIQGVGVNGYAKASTGITSGVQGNSDSIDGRGVFGWATVFTGTTYGVYGKSESLNGRGVYGYANRASGTTYGVYGQSDSVSGIGVQGHAEASTGFTYGVYGLSKSVSGKGVYGNAYASTGTNYGVYGESQSVAGRGVFGYADASTGYTYGVYGLSDSLFGVGVFGDATAHTGYTCGVWGQSDSVSSSGVYGLNYSATGDTFGIHGRADSMSGKGVFGEATAATGITYGVYGQSGSQSGISVIGQAGNAGTKPIVARGHSSQTASLQEWQNTSGTPFSVVSKDGYLGIGTSSPATALHVKSSSSNPAIRIENENAYVGEFIYCFSNTHMPFFSGRRARGNMTSPSAVQSGDELMRYGASGYGSTGFPGGNRALLKFFAAENWTDTEQGTYITMETTPTGSTAATERLRVTSNGSVVPGSDNNGSIGIASKRWADLYVVNLHQGDLIFQNGYKVTEDETAGLAFKNDAGEKIAVLDRQGNIHIKGEIIKDL